MIKIQFIISQKAARGNRFMKKDKKIRKEKNFPALPHSEWRLFFTKGRKPTIKIVHDEEKVENRENGTK